MQTASSPPGEVALPPAVPGARLALDGAGGPVTLYAAHPDGDAGGGRPLLLVHSVNAAGSTYEVRPIYEHYRARRPVYALDLPGFGLSDRSERIYEPRLMTDALLAAVAEVRRRHGDAPIDALALSLAAEFLARAACEQAAAFRTVALVSPTGFARRWEREGPAGSTLGKPWLHAILTRQAWRRGLFATLTRKGSIRYFLRRTYGAPDVDEGMVEYDYLTTHQPGAEHAPLSFLSGFLFSCDVGPLYRGLGMPVWLAHGVRGDFTDYAYKDTFAGRRGWSFDVFQTGALPHFERPDEFFARYDAFLAAADGA